MSLIKIQLELKLVSNLLLVDIGTTLDILEASFQNRESFKIGRSIEMISY